MGRQSARIFFGGKDHKDIYFNGHYHDQVYISDSNGNVTLVWEKIKESEGFSFEINSSEESYFLRLRLSGLVNVDWGDGKTTGKESEESELVGHWYRGIGKYKIQIKGALTDISFSDGANQALSRILTVFPKTMRNKTDYSYMFAQCTKLYDIPDALFDNCSNAQNFHSVFNGCALGTIPSGLFNKCPNAISFSNAFNGCYSVKSIPSGLFSGCPAVTDFSNVFYTCDNITDIPPGLFGNCPNAENFHSAFANCYSLKSVPSGLFGNCPKVKNFGSAFRYCRSITSRVPELWKTHTDASHSSCFLGCTSAANYGDIPDSWKNI